MIIVGLFFLFVHKNICCGYWLEVPLMCTHNMCFYGKSEKIVP